MAASIVIKAVVTRSEIKKSIEALINWQLNGRFSEQQIEKFCANVHDVFRDDILEIRYNGEKILIGPNRVDVTHWLRGPV